MILFASRLSSIPTSNFDSKLSKPPKLNPLRRDIRYGLTPFIAKLTIAVFLIHSTGNVSFSLGTSYPVSFSLSLVGLRLHSSMMPLLYY